MSLACGKIRYIPCVDTVHITHASDLPTLVIPRSDDCGNVHIDCPQRGQVLKFENEEIIHKHGSRNGGPVFWVLPGAAGAERLLALSTP